MPSECGSPGGRVNPSQFQFIRRNTIKVIIVCLVVVLLSGCASLSSPKGKTPDLTYSSAKTPKALAMCIVDKWEGASSIGTTPVNQREIKDGYTLFVNNGRGAVCIIADIVESSGYSQVSVRNNCLFAEQMTQDAKSCQ